MSEETGSSDGYQIRPFDEDWADEVERLRGEVIAVRDKVSPFSMEAPDPDDTTLEANVTSLVSPYGLNENDRHHIIRSAAASVGQLMENFGHARQGIGFSYIETAFIMSMKLGGVLLIGMQAGIGDFVNYLRGITDQLTQMTEGKTREALQDYAQSQQVDSKRQLLIGQYALRCGLAGKLIDAGNEFLNLNFELRVLLRSYVDGRVPHGWRNHLPAPLRSIFSEAVWTGIEEGVRIGIEAGLGAAAGPFSAIPVGGARIALSIREQRERELRKFRRSDVDELLDLSGQLSTANDNANEIRESLKAIVEASRAT